MSILCDLIEVPDDFLDLFKNYRKARFLYYRASNTREELNIGSISKFSQEQSRIVREICEVYPNYSHEIKQIWNLDNCKSVLQYKTNHFEEYNKIQEHIPRINKARYLLGKAYLYECCKAIALFEKFVRLFHKLSLFSC